MHTLDRSQQPEFNIPQSISRILPQVVSMPNGIRTYLVHSGTQDVMRISIVFEAGTRFQPQPFVASTAVHMLNEGSSLHKAAEIAEMLDFYGASYEVNVDRDWVTLSVYCLNKYCGPVLSIVRDFIINPTYPEKELEVYKQKNKQRLKLEREKVEVLAREHFLAGLYGAKHPYGISAPDVRYDKVHRDLLLSFHQQWLTSSNAFMLLAGKFGEKEVAIVQDLLGKDAWGGNAADVALPPFQPLGKRIINVTKKDAVQAAIRMGRVLFQRSHPDFVGMQVLVTVLGGYFGSRLMTNIREEKGYTYGIYSVMVPQQHSVHLSIATETSVEYKDAVIREIYHEMTVLQNELITEDELNLVKQYLYGELLRGLDGPWAQAEVAIEVAQSKLPSNYVEQMFEEIKQLKPDHLRELARRYLGVEDMLQVVVANE